MTKVRIFRSVIKYFRSYFVRYFFTLVFTLTSGIIKNFLSITRKNKKKHDKILILAKRALNSIEALVS